MPSPDRPRIAIIGAGMAGISCAHALQQFGCAPVVLEKSRGIGGRMATRRTAEGEHFDHGAQYVTARHEGLQQMLQTLERDQTAASWAPHDPARPSSPSQRWMVGMPGMSTLLRPLADTLDLHTETTVAALHKDAAGWRLSTDDGTSWGTFDAVVCTAPAPQCHALFHEWPAMRSALAQVGIAPCWAVMVRFADALPVSFDARRHETGTIGWLALQSSRPGYPGKSHGWVLHASPEWSQMHIDHPAGQIVSLLLQALAKLINNELPPTLFTAAHRWRYALTTRPLEQAFLVNDKGDLYAAGDWCLGARVEYAHASGLAVAEALAARFQLDMGKRGG